MTTIKLFHNLVTLINVFTVEPAHGSSSSSMYSARATDETIRHMPGFVSANIHKSVDGCACDQLCAVAQASDNLRRDATRARQRGRI